MALIFIAMVPKVWSMTYRYNIIWELVRNANLGAWVRPSKLLEQSPSDPGVVKQLYLNCTQ